MTSAATMTDTLRGLLEPGAGVAKDDTLAEPPRYAPNTLYAWPVREAWIPDGVGMQRHEVTIRVAWGADRKGEVDSEVRFRDVSLAVDAKVTAYRAVVVDNEAPIGGPAHGVWSQAAVRAVDYDTLRGDDARGFRMDIAVWLYD